jgi:hypothetical protein
MTSLFLPITAMVSLSLSLSLSLARCLKGSHPTFFRCGTHDEDNKNRSSGQDGGQGNKGVGRGGHLDARCQRGGAAAAAKMCNSERGCCHTAGVSGDRLGACPRRFFFLFFCLLVSLVSLLVCVFLSSFLLTWMADYLSPLEPCIVLLISRSPGALQVHH